MEVETKNDEIWDGAKSLAFTSISTTNFQFDHTMAVDIIVATTIEFFKNPNHAELKLVFVDAYNDSNMVDQIVVKATEVGFASMPLVIYFGDITRLFSLGGPQCNCIANATNWQLKPSGGGVNKEIFEAAGFELELATKEITRTLKPGEAVTVSLPPSSPLRRLEGVTHVIHVLGPNMNSIGPHALAGDYKKGCEILSNAYSNLFKSFSSIALKDRKKLNSPFMPFVERISTKSGGQSNESMIQGPYEINDSFPTDSTKRKGLEEFDYQQKREKLNTTDSKLNDENYIKESPKRDDDIDIVGTDGVLTKKQFKEGNHTNFGNVGIIAKKSNVVKTTQIWEPKSEELQNIGLYPEKCFPPPLEVTKEAIVIFDKYPKAKKHLLVISRKDGLDTLENVCIQDLSLLKYMHSLGEKWARQCIKEDSTLLFRLGYHWISSMRQLHMHVISQDFDSPNLNIKKHWNSFTTAFFRDSKDVMVELEERGQIMPCNVDIQGKFMSMELRCHRCRSAQPSMPRLRTHVPTCPFPLECPYLISHVPKNEIGD